MQLQCKKLYYKTGHQINNTFEVFCFKWVPGFLDKLIAPPQFGANDCNIAVYTIHS